MRDPESSYYTPGEGMGVQIALSCLLLVAMVLVVAKKQVEDLKDELRVARDSRESWRLAASKDRDQLDGALATIHRLKHPANDDQEPEHGAAPEPDPTA